MLLSQLLKNVKYTSPSFSDREIDDIVYDSRKASAGKLFTALTGAFTDGHDYAESAYLKGARVFVTERVLPLPSDATVIVTENSRAALGVMSEEFFGHPEKEVDIVGVTGTKGKTTVTHMLRHCLDECGIKSGVIGTVGAYYGDRFVPTVNTTPESYEIMRLLRMMADDGVKTVCMEVSSIGLKAHRTDGIEFAAAVFTNLSPDHIGGAEHDSFEEYAYWKKQLFRHCKKAYLCADDLFSDEIIKELTCPYETFAVNTDADMTADGIKPLGGSNFFGVSFNIECDGKTVAAKTAMPGVFNVENALAAVSVCKGFGIPTEKAAAALATAKVKGRNECIPVDADFDVIIDYAHNGQSFNSVLDTFSVYPHSRIITVFGSVGDRAQLRRREMGEMSGRKADLSIITSDDPGYEDPMKIDEEIADAVKKAGGECIIEPDRKTAVFKALDIAEKGDIVLILGKGHETAQKIKGEKVHYSDHETVEEYFRRKK